MARLRLVEADRQRLGCAELLHIDLGSVTNREAIALRKQGFPTTRLLAKALASAPDADGHYEAWTAYVWLALHKAGIVVDPAELVFSLQLEILADEEPVEPVVEVGKAPEVHAASTSSPRKRSTSTATSRRKSPTR